MTSDMVPLERRELKMGYGTFLGDNRAVLASTVCDRRCQSGLNLAAMRQWRGY